MAIYSIEWRRQLGESCDRRCFFLAPMGTEYSGAPLPPFLELRIVRDLRTPISVSAENEEVTDSGFRLKTGKTRCWLVTAHYKGFTRASIELASDRKNSG